MVQGGNPNRETRGQYLAKVIVGWCNGILNLMGVVCIAAAFQARPTEMVVWLAGVWEASSTLCIGSVLSRSAWYFELKFEPRIWATLSFIMLCICV